MEKLIALLKQFGVTETEAKAYIALLQNGPGTGYEVSKLSGVPRSKIYNALEALISKGFVVYSQSEKTTLYKAEPAEQMLGLLRTQTDRTLRRLRDEMQDFDYAADNERIWQLKGHRSVLNKCELLMREATRQIMLQVWVNELDEALEDLIAAQRQKGVNVLVILYDEHERYETRLENVYRHGFETDKILDAGSRWISLTVDQREMCYATIKGNNSTEGIYTRNKSMVFFADEYIRHDAYCLRLIDALSEDVKQVFGENMKGIRDIFSVQ